MKTIHIVTVAVFCLCVPIYAQIPINTLGSTYTQNFDNLANAGTTNTLTAPGWEFLETGASANAAYAGGNGGLATGDTYSYGQTGSTDRALGGLRSSSLIPIFGASFANVTGSTITSITISYTGEEWRLGNHQRGPDRLDFQYSTDATSLTTGAWTDVDSLDFLTPNLTGPGGIRDGNLPENQSVRSQIIIGLAIPPGAVLWIRWMDVDATNSDDGLAVDNFSLRAVAPSAAAVNVSGRVRTAGGLPIRNALLTVIGGDLSGPVTVATGSFGLFSFNNLRAGQTYVVTVKAGRHSFAEPVRTVVPMDNVDDLDFVAN